MTRLKIFLTVTLCFVGTVEFYPQDRNPGSEVPQDMISLLIVSDPKSPVQISGPVKIYGYAKGGFRLGYTLTNVSRADVESMSINETDWFGAKGYEKDYEVKKDARFVPGTSRYPLTDSAAEPLIPFEKNKDLQARVEYARNKTWIVMLVKVKLVDGSVYDATEKYRRLEDFLQEKDRSSPLDGADLKNWDAEVRRFVNNLMASEK